MIKRIIDISEAAYLHLKHQQLLIDKGGETVGKIAIEDLGILILQDPAIVLTQQLIIACQKNKVVIVFCDEKHLPYSLSYPLQKAILCIVRFLSSKSQSVNQYVSVFGSKLFNKK